VNDYLGMTFDFSHKGKVVVDDMIDYITAMVNDFPTKKPTDVASTPAAEDLFAQGKSENLEKETAENLHTFVAKALFAWHCLPAREHILISTKQMQRCVHE
jgi:hypothetical protein